MYRTQQISPETHADRPKIPQHRWLWRGQSIVYTYYPAQDTAQSSLAPMLLIHGFGASIRHWRDNFETLSRDRPVYGIDLLGFGASQKTATVYGTALWVEQVCDFIEQVVGRSVVVVGNSLGSVVGLGLAAKHPDCVAAIAWLNLPDFSAIGMGDTLKAITGPIGAIAKRAITFPPFFVPFFRWIRQPGIIRAWVQGAYIDRRRLDHDLIDLLSSPAYQPGATRALATMVRSQRTLPLEYTSRGALGQMTLPMLLVWGERDSFVPPSIAQKLVEFNPAVKLIYLPNIGHCPHDECPEIVNSLLLDWIKERGV
jgi:pimeloyl-ACP methyl ester carboxylesterase